MRCHNESDNNSPTPKPIYLYCPVIAEKREKKINSPTTKL